MGLFTIYRYEDITIVHCKQLRLFTLYIYYTRIILPQLIDNGSLPLGEEEEEEEDEIRGGYTVSTET